MNDLMREEFEAKALSAKAKNGMICDFRRDSNDEYMSACERSAWWAWQASRESLVIELPPSIGVTPVGGDGIQEFIDCNGEYLHGYAVFHAINSAGVRVK